MLDLHRHDEFSTFDGFSNAEDLAILAKEIGYTALGTTNHGSMSGLVRTNRACKKHGIKAVLGVEGYFLPKHVPQQRGYHLILIAKNKTGYANLNRIQFEGDKQKYYNAIWDFDLLSKYSEGIICTTACIAGYLSQCVNKGNYQMAEKFIKKMKDIFNDDFYIEIQPYKLSENGLQEEINIKLIELANKFGVKCILASDSHRGKKEDIDSYLKMHDVAQHKFDDLDSTYGERYMPKLGDLRKRFYLMHKHDFGEKKAKRMAIEFEANTQEIEDKCEEDYLSQLKLQLPKIGNGEDTKEKLKKDIIAGLKKRNVHTKEYIERCKEEIKVILFHGFEDYFLIVADYVKYAKDKGIAVGPGRGSVCNCLVAYALGITETDSLAFGLDFRRFLREDKKKFPDIDLDFQTSRRAEVIEYLIEKYKGHAARISSYGLYKTDNLLNDLGKICGLMDIEDGKQKISSELAEIKSIANEYIVDGHLHAEELLSNHRAKLINAQYDNILTHFTKLYGQVRFMGTHAAGVAITGGELLDYMALKTDAYGNISTVFDLEDVEALNVIKFDILGLKTMEILSDLREATGVNVDLKTAIKDKKIIEAFRDGNTDGVFQFEKPTPRGILKKIDCDCFDDIVATSAMNRPGPLQLKMPDIYAESKRDISNVRDELYYQYTKETYGTIIYQEQVQQICIHIGGLMWTEADKVMKMLKGTGTEEDESKLSESELEKRRLRKKFVEGAISKGMDERKALELFDNMTAYSFNKGHSVGYTLISVEEMFYKIYHPLEYWFAKLKYAKDDFERIRFCERAANDGVVIFLPHVNYSKTKTTIGVHDGEKVIQLGITSIKGIGDKAADSIVEERENGKYFKSYDDFFDRCKGRAVTKKVIELLKEQGAIELNKKIYVSRVIKYNSSLISRR